MINLSAIKNRIRQYYAIDQLDLRVESQLGGDIHQSYKLELCFEQKNNVNRVPKHLFMKVNSGFAAEVLKTEFESLKIINSIYPHHYPKALLFDKLDDQGLLLMSFHDLRLFNHVDSAEAGRSLAAQHRLSNDDFGWSRDNHIGLTPQSNQPHQCWVTFFGEQRLAPMLGRALHRGLPISTVDNIKQVVDKLDELLNHEVAPSLVHGDLWSGNLGFDQSLQQALFYDPAPYYGDREVDIAMTELFGRQPASFYQAYNQQWPLPAGYQQRRPVYNLYHALNHLVLFGDSYLGLVDDCLQQIKLTS